MVDASSDRVDAALQQQSSPSFLWQPLAFFSKKLEPGQVGYSAFDRDLLAGCAGVRHFRYKLEGQPFTIYTDHKLLTYALGKVCDGWKATPRAWCGQRGGRHTVQANFCGHHWTR
jgi:hypothetical protein